MSQIFTPIRPRRLAEEIADKVRSYILEGSLRPGDRLPAERQLAEEFDTSRPTVRDALKILEDEGLLQMRRGGLHVLDVMEPAIRDPLTALFRSNPAVFDDYLEFRAVIEGMAAYFAALRATEADREALKAAFDEIMAAPMVHEPLTKLQCCPTSDGSAAVVLASEDFVRSHGLTDQAVEIIGMSMRTDFPSSFDSGSDMKFVGWDMSKAAAQDVYEQSGKGPEDVDVIELHDCFSANELITYEALGLCKEGEAEKFIWDGDNTYGGKFVTNPSGGLLSKGHPLGATGLAQCTELVWQLRGQAEQRQVPNAKVALQHNLGLGGACVMTMYRRD